MDAQRVTRKGVKMGLLESKLMLRKIINAELLEFSMSDGLGHMSSGALGEIASESLKQPSGMFLRQQGCSL